MIRCYQKHGFRKWTSVFGMFLLLCPLGAMWYWGNMAVYVDSYVIKNVDRDSDVEGPWMMSCFEVGASIGLFLSALLVKHIGKRWTVVCGTIFVICGLAGAHFIVDFSAIFMQMVMGFFTGLGEYVTGGVVMRYAAEWATNDFGFINSIAQSGLTAGSIVINQIMTLYINPDNLSPDVDQGSTKYFSDDGILDRVPFAFLILMGIVFFCTVVGMLLIRDNSLDPEKQTSGKIVAGVAELPIANGTGNETVDFPKVKINVEDDSTKHSTAETETERNGNVPQESSESLQVEEIDNGTPVFHNVTVEINVEDESTKNLKAATERNGNDAQESSASFQVEGTGNGTPDINKVTVETNVEDESTKNSKMETEMETEIGSLQVEKPNTEPATEIPELSPKQLIRNPIYYVYSFFALLGTLTYVVLTTYYKKYGQLYIHDDHFLTNISIALLIAMTIARTGWGKLMDKVGVKMTFVIHFSGCALTSLAFYFSPLLDKWCYTVMTLAFACTGSAIYVIEVYSALRTFGEKHFVVNFGFIILPATLIMLFLSPVFKYVIVDLGWFSLYALCSSWNILGLIMTIVFLPEKKSKKRKVTGPAPVESAARVESPSPVGCPGRVESPARVESPTPVESPVRVESPACE